MIEVRDLSFRYKKNTDLVLEHISFNLKAGEILAILGKNGIGKTTLLRCLTGELADYTGSIKVCGRELKSYSINERSQIMAIVSSNFSSYQNLKVADYLVTGFANKLTSLNGPNKSQYEKAFTTLEALGQGKLFNSYIYELSSGEMQIIKIARAILQNPKLIIFDEPTSNLDIGNQLIVLNQISLLSQASYTIITTTHNPGQAMELNDMVLMLAKQQYIYGKCHDVMNEKNLSDIYNLNIRLEHGRFRDYAICEDTSKLHKLVY